MKMFGTGSIAHDGDVSPGDRVSHNGRLGTIQDASYLLEMEEFVESLGDTDCFVEFDNEPGTLCCVPFEELELI
jgi:hypothetical protein